MVIDDHTSDARTIENENNEQSLQGYKTPCGLFLVAHTINILVPSLLKIGELALSYELNRLAYYHCRKGQIRV